MAADQSQNQAQWDELHKLLSKYDPNDIYGLDETGLFYQMTPSDTVFAGPADAQERPRLTLVLMCNATGIDKAPPLILGGISMFHG